MTDSWQSGALRDANGALVVTGKAGAPAGFPATVPTPGAPEDQKGFVYDNATGAMVWTDLATQAELNAHTGNVANPHAVTKTQVGLGNVDNTSDANKPISTAEQAALDSRDSVYSTLILRSQGFAATVVTGAATYVLRAIGSNATSGDLPSGTNGGLGAFYFDPANFAVTGKSVKCRVTSSLLGNTAGSGVNWTVGLYPVSAVAGGSAALTVTLGTVVAGSTIAFTSPTGMNQSNSGDFDAPAAGYYTLAVVVSGAMAANSYIVLHSSLRQRVV